MSDKNTVAKTLSFLIVTIGIYLLLWQTLITRIQLPVYYYGRLIEVLGMGLFIALAVSTPMKFEEMGIVTSRKTLFASLRLAFVLTLAMLGVLLIAAQLFPTTPFFSWRLKEDISRVTYFFSAPIQELLAKSVMYYSFELCFGREHPVLITLMCTLVFGMFHVVYGIRMMLLAMALTVLTSWMFHRHRCVWGCALVHFTFGFFPDCFGFIVG